MRRLFLLVTILGLLLAGCSQNNYADGMVRYGDRWITQEEYNRLSQPAPSQLAPSPKPAPVAAPSPAPTTISVPAASSPPVQKPTFSPITFTGRDDRTTAPFTVTTKEWIIDWSFTGQPEWTRRLLPQSECWQFRQLDYHHSSSSIKT